MPMTADPADGNPTLQQHRLDGPTTGVLILPNHLDQFDEQHRRDPVDLIDPQYTDALYKVILNRARDTDDLRHLNHDVLVDAWPRLALPTPLRDQWGNRFDELAGRGRHLDPLRGPMHGLGKQYVLAESCKNLDGPTTG
jgi:hypothetical protein